jgi:hypothetical protein
MGGTGQGIAEENSVGVRDVLGGPSILLVPTVCEFVPKTGAESQIETQLHNILNIPGAFG